MDNIINKYIKFVEDFLFDFYRIILRNNYEKKIIEVFVKKYIDARYYIGKSYSNSDDFIEMINIKLQESATEMIKKNEDKEDKIKNIFALFSYILYIDDCLELTNTKALLKTLFNDNNIKINYTDDMKATLDETVRNFIIKKKNFFKTINATDFELKYRRLKRGLYLTKIEHKCKMSDLYSDYAIDTAYNSELVTENKFYLMCVLLSGEILKASIKSESINSYVVDFPVTLFKKSKKYQRYLKLFDNKLIQNCIVIRFTYREYKMNKTEINKIIKDGYNVSIVLDDAFIDDYQSLILFKYVFLYEKYQYYDIIIDSREDYNTTFVTL